MRFCRALQICSILIPTIYLSSLIGVFTAFSAEVNTFTNFTRHMDKNKRVLSMMLDNRAESVKGPVMLHFPSWYQATHGGYVAFNFNSLVKLLFSQPVGFIYPIQLKNNDPNN